MFVLATGGLGYALRGFDIRDIHDAAGQRWATVHRLSGVAAAIALVLVNSIVVTYFVGTGRWCKEVSDTYQLGPTFVRRSNAIKRQHVPAVRDQHVDRRGYRGLGWGRGPGRYVSWHLHPV